MTFEIIILTPELIALPMLLPRSLLFYKNDKRPDISGRSAFLHLTAALNNLPPKS